tara:strand:+ start:84 stop:392 length:309 start_codon:yes stop_codon:yes gene_type:complete
MKWFGGPVGARKFVSGEEAATTAATSIYLRPSNFLFPAEYWARVYHRDNIEEVVKVERDAFAAAGADVKSRQQLERSKPYYLDEGIWKQASAGIESWTRVEK